MTKASKLTELDIMPGVMPSTDGTAYDIPCWSYTDKVRFDPSTGRIRKIGGWESNDFDYGETISGTVRTIFSSTINQKVYTLLGTFSHLYSLVGSILDNITPFETSSEAIPDSLDTHYETLANNPIATVSGSNFVTITDTEAALFKVSDQYVLAGATTTNGIADTLLNATHIVRSIGVNEISIYVGATANATGSGGGASVVRSSGLITVNDNAHGLLDGERIKIEDAATTGGIADTEINKEFIIRNVLTNSFDIMADTPATSSVSAGGGSSTIYFPPLENGNENQGQAQGYGAGLYGIGLYGTALASNAGETYPRIWFADRFGEKIVLTTGNQGAAYVYDPTTGNAPAIIANAPTTINYLFVSDNTLVTFGNGTENKIFSADQGSLTNWTASSVNTVYEDSIEGVGRLISHAPIDGANLIFTEQQTLSMKFIGLPNVWSIQVIDSNIGLIAPLARCSVNGIAYWMGQDNFYMYRGGKVETIPSNFSAQSSILRYVFDNLNYSQRFGIFCWYNEKYDEIWWHYPSGSASNPDRIARFSRKLGAWMPDTMNRTAAEAPLTSLSNPRLANLETLYTHETGNDADGAALPWEATTRKFITGTDTSLTVNIVPDSTMTENISFDFSSYNYPQSQTPMSSNSYTVTPTTEKVAISSNGRFWQMSFSGNALDQSYLMGQWLIDAQPSARAP